MTDPTRPRRACSPLTSGDLGLKTRLCESADGVVGKMALGLVRSRFVIARDRRPSHDPIWSSNIDGL